ncbi:MAG: hypothetical protein AB7L09_21365 [Nitrospira sp.]
MVEINFEVIVEKFKFQNGKTGYRIKPINNATWEHICKPGEEDWEAAEVCMKDKEFITVWAVMKTTPGGVTVDVRWPTGQAIAEAAAPSKPKIIT